MKAKAKIKVSKEEYFDFIIDNVLLEIKQYAHKNVQRDRLKEGYTYRKTLSVKKKKYMAEVRIECLNYPSDYRSITKVGNGKSYMISYHIDDKHVYYHEEVVDQKKDVITPIPEIAFGFLKKLRVKKRLKMISDIIIYRKKHRVEKSQEESM